MIPDVYSAVTPPMPEGLTLVEEALGAEGWRARVRVEASCPLFDGHFDGAPILPGIAQLALVRRGLAVLAGLGMAGLPSVRFRRPIRPGDVLDVLVARPDADGRLRFEVRAGPELAGGGVAQARRHG